MDFTFQLQINTYLSKLDGIAKTNAASVDHYPE